MGFVEDGLDLVVTEVHLTVLVDAIFKRTLTLECCKCGTCHEFVLLECYFMTCSGKHLFRSVTHAEVQEDFFTLLFGLCQLHLGHLNRYHFLFAFTTSRECHLLLSNDVTILHHFVNEVEV